MSEKNEPEIPEEFREQLRLQAEQMAIQQASDATLASLKEKMIDESERELHATINTLRDISGTESEFCMAIAALDRIMKARNNLLGKDPLSSQIKAVLLDLFAATSAREAQFLREGQKAHDAAVSKLRGSRTKEGA